MKLWGGRFETGPSEVFERFSGSLDFARRLIDADIRGSQAFARALERVGILTADERAQIVDAFDAIRAESASPSFYDGATDEGVHTLDSRKLQERAGADDLGIDAITRNSMDVSADRDFALDFLYAATTTMLHLSRLAEDWILYSSEEFAWMELGDGVTSGSSLMPQKKSTDSLALI